MALNLIEVRISPSQVNTWVEVGDASDWKHIYNGRPATLNFAFADQESDIPSTYEGPILEQYTAVNRDFGTGRCFVKSTFTTVVHRAI